MTIALAFARCLVGCGNSDAAAHRDGSADVEAVDAIEPPDEGRPDDAPHGDGQGPVVADGANDSAAKTDASAGEGGLRSDAGCPVHSTPSTLAGSAVSSGFAGSPLAYDSLFGLPCRSVSDCATSCTSAGGTPSSCSAGSDCLTGAASDGGLGCLPPTFWLQPNLALSELDSTSSAANIRLEVVSYFDSLIVTDFGLSIPSGASIQGVQFDVRRATLLGFGEDESIRALQAGSPVGLDHRKTVAWDPVLTYATYGGPDDDWGVPWTIADVASSGFGVSITPEYTNSAGNDPAYVDSVRATVYYTTASCD